MKSGRLTGTVASAFFPGACRVRSIIMTPPDANRTILTLYHGQDVSRPDGVIVSATGGGTIVVGFDNLPFPSGFTVVPDTDVTYYAIEYVADEESAD